MFLVIIFPDVHAWSLTVGVWISVEILTNRLIIRYTKAVCGAVELKVLTC